MKEAIISLGSNLGDLEGNLNSAVQMLLKSGYEIVACSCVYETEAIGFASENKFYNAIVAVNTIKEAEEVLHDLLQIEKLLGRTRVTKGYIDRIIDLDLIDYSKVCKSDEVLTLPHPRYRERLFVLVPLRDVQPDWVDLSTGVGIDEMINALSNQVFPLKSCFHICVKNS
jgi:2-amino-4-hydroxy-6-hydroxymethyldihydropteridine diphosphokinase